MSIASEQPPAPRRAQQLWKWFKTGIPPHAGMTPDDARSFHTWTRQTLARDLLWLLPVLTAINIAFWLTDPWAFRGDAHIISVMQEVRTATVLVATGVWLFNLSWPRYVRMSGALGGGSACFFLARGMGLLGGPSTPWFHFLYPFVLILLISWATPLMRLWWTAFFALSILAGYFGANPAWLQDPMIIMSLLYFFYILMLAYLIGVYVDDFRLRFYLRQRALERSEIDLARRVEVKTGDLRALVTRLDDIQDSERARLARDLHDDLGQMLTAQKLVLRTARRRYEASADSIGPNLSQIDGLLGQTTQRFRELLQGLRPRILEESGHDAGIRALVRLAESQLGFTVTLTIEAPDAAIPGPIALVSYRCVQEAFTNIIKHAQASAAYLTLEIRDDHLHGEIGDDGVGFDPAQVRAGLGLIGARERIESVGGAFALERPPAGGARLTFRLPLEGAETP